MAPFDYVALVILALVVLALSWGLFLMHFDVTRLERETRLAAQIQRSHREELSDLKAQIRTLQVQLKKMEQK